MFITLSPRSPDPLYKQVMDQIRDAIATGELAPNEKLPSIRELARGLDVSMITVKRAYQDLETTGYILTRQGLGCYVAPVDKGRLRDEKLRDLESDLARLLSAARKHEITKEDLIRLIREMEEE